MAETQFRYLDARKEQDVLVLTITEPQLQTDALVDDLRQELLSAVGQDKGQKVVLNFQNVKYLSSAGFRPLLGLRRKMQELGGRMVLCCLDSEVANVFRITRMISTSGSSAAVFEVKEDLPAAVRHLSPAPA